jgi:hypothetical protein
MTTLLALTYTFMFVAGVFTTVVFGMAILHGAVFAVRTGRRAGAETANLMSEQGSSS